VNAGWVRRKAQPTSRIFHLVDVQSDEGLKMRGFQRRVEA